MAGRSIEPFFSPEELASFRAKRRARRIKGVKQVLKVIQEVQLCGLPGNVDLALDDLAKRIYVAFYEV